MHSDTYMKVVLTVIAVALVWVCVRDVTLVKPAHAVGWTDVNIAAMGGIALTGVSTGYPPKLPVKIED